jgi:16S rRNA (guanine966-N2)-methyltransferase
MRVVSGSARGRALKMPKDPKGIRTTRPMTDKIKEALFDVLASLGVEAERVLDLYAGSGSLGIEALSRGATWCDFVERDPFATRAIRENLESVGFADNARVHQTQVETAIQTSREPYDLILFDPPYADPEIIAILDALSSADAVMDGTIVAVGHSPRVELPDQIGRMERLRKRCHGDSCFSVYDVVLDGGRDA